MKPARTLLLLFLVACAERDRVVLVFAEPAAREEAARVEVYAIALATRGGEAVDCDALRAQRRTPDDGEVVVAQHTRLALPLPADATPLLVQVPQDRYLFFAEAFDRFGFRVAQGCTVDDVTSARRLELRITLDTVPALEGELSAIAGSAWLQHAGLPGLETARALEVQALGPGGLLVDVEVRTLIDSGEGVVIEPLLHTDARGHAGSTLLIGAGPVRALVHVRGLRGSPVGFELQGVPSPTYQPESNAVWAEPLTLLVDDFVVDAAGAPDLMAVMRDSAGVFGMAWRADPQGSTFATGRRFELDVDLSAIASGHLDVDRRTDLVYAVPPTSAGELPGLYVQHHEVTVGDNFSAPIVEVLPSDVVAVTGLLTAIVDGDARHDVVLVGQTATRRVLLLYLSRAEDPETGSPVLMLRQRFEIPDFIDDAEVLAGDLDGDGDDDLILSSTTFGLWIVPCGTDAEGHGNSVFYVPPNVEPADWPHLFAAIGVHLIAVRDVDEDGRNDLLVVSDSSVLGAGVGLRLARGTGQLIDLSLEGRQELPVDTTNRMVVADLNADGHLDLLLNTLSPPRRAILMGGDGTGAFANPLPLRTDMSSVGMAVADLNLDGIVDAGFLGTTTGTERFFQVYMTSGLAQ